VKKAAANATQLAKCILLHAYWRTTQRCARSGVQEWTPAGVGAFQQKPEQDQEWIFSIEIGAGAGVIFNHSVFEIYIDYLHSTQFVIGVQQEQESIIFLQSGVIPGAGVKF